MLTAQDILTTDYPTLREDDTIAKFIGAIRKKHFHTALVVDSKGKYTGIVDKKLLLRSYLDIEHMKVKKCRIHCPKLDVSDSTKTMIEKFNTSDVNTLPVFKKDKLIGVVKLMDLLNAVKQAVRNIRAAEIMTTLPLVLAENEKIGKAINIMTQNKLHHLPVVDSMGKMTGMVSLADILEKLHTFSQRKMRIPRAASHQQHRQSGYGVGEKTSMTSCPASNLMNKECCVSAPNDTLSKVIDAMVEHNHSAAVVAKNAVPIGIVTAKDILVKAQKTIV